MTPVFISMACNYCDGLETLDAPFVGYVVWSDDFTCPARAYVFSRAEFAERWHSMRGPERAHVRKVASAYPFNWRSGVQATSDLEFADTLVEIHLDVRYEPGPHQAHLI
jgi:hypothetical protein